MQLQSCYASIQEGRKHLLFITATHSSKCNRVTSIQRSLQPNGSNTSVHNVHVCICMYGRASGKDFSNSSENIKSKLSREQENSGWKRKEKKKNKREGEKWGCVCVYASSGNGWNRDIQRDKKGLCVHACVCTHLGRPVK